MPTVATLCIFCLLFFMASGCGKQNTNSLPDKEAITLSEDDENPQLKGNNCADDIIEDINDIQTKFWNW